MSFEKGEDCLEATSCITYAAGRQPIVEVPFLGLGHPLGLGQVPTIASCLGVSVHHEGIRINHEDSKTQRNLRQRRTEKVILFFLLRAFESLWFSFLPLPGGYERSW